MINIAEEFTNILNEIKKKPFEEKLNSIIDTFEKIISLIFKISELVDDKLSSIQQQINLIKIQLNQMKQKITIKNLPEIETLISRAPSASPNSINTNKPFTDTRKIIMSELQELLKKRKENIGEK